MGFLQSDFTPMNAALSQDRLVAYYATPEPNASVSLLGGDARLEQNGSYVKGHAEAQLRWTPIGVPQFEIQGNGDVDAIDFGDALVHIDSVGAAAKVRVARRGGSRGAFTGVLVDDFCFGTSTELQSLVFHVVNFPKMERGDRELNSDETVASGTRRLSTWARLLLDSDRWTITLDPVVSLHELEGELRASGGYAITWTGKITRRDGAKFEAVDGRSVANAVSFFLSFAVGRWCHAVLLVGLDGDGDRVWECWGPQISDGWRFSQGWLDPKLGHCLSKAFPGFFKTWERQETWHTPLQDAVHWFVESTKTSPGLDGAIALAQIALEMLAWVVFVEDRQVVSAAAFKALPAADKLRMLLHWCSIPLCVPDQLSTLKRVAKGTNCTGAGLVTDMRNWIIHSHQKNRVKLASLIKTYNCRKSDLAWETHRLMTWYIELVLLRQFEYKGEYASRLAPRKLGQPFDMVPWAT